MTLLWTSQLEKWFDHTVSETPFFYSQPLEEESTCPPLPSLAVGKPTVGPGIAGSITLTHPQPWSAALFECNEKEAGFWESFAEFIELKLIQGGPFVPRHRVDSVSC